MATYENGTPLTHATAEGGSNVQNSNNTVDINGIPSRHQDRTAAFEVDEAAPEDIVAAAAYLARQRPRVQHGTKFADLTLSDFKTAFGAADANGPWINVPGPGHSLKHRTLGIKSAPDTHYGFIINSFADDGFETCRQYVIDALGLAPTDDDGNGPRLSTKQLAAKRAVERKAFDEAKDALLRKKQAVCLQVFTNAADASENAELYFKGRGDLPLPSQVFRETHSYVSSAGEIMNLGRNAGHWFLAAQIIGFESKTPVGLHFTAMEPSSRNRAVENYAVYNYKKNRESSRFISGSGEGYIELSVGSAEGTLCVGEGIETVLSVLKLHLETSDLTLWSLLNKGNIKKLVPFGAYRTIIIVVDKDEAPEGQKMCSAEIESRALAKAWASAGVKAVLVLPMKPAGEKKFDLNDVAKVCAREGRKPAEGRDYSIEVLEAVAYADEEEVADIDPRDPHPDPDTLEAAIIKLNQRFFFAPDGGKAWVVERTLDRTLGETHYMWHTPTAFTQIFMNRTFPVVVPGKRAPTMVDLGTAWLKSPKRKQYLGGVTFDPGGKHSPDHFNSWEGFAFTPKKGDWSKTRAYIHDIICSGNSVHFDYLLKWMARAVQFPSQQGEVAVVLRSEEGTGKGFFARTFMRLFGPHVQHVSDAKALTGDFNEHLEHAVIVFADEAWFAGDKANVGKLLAVITEPTISIEPKGRGRKRVKNCLHVIMASNQEWVVPASKKRTAVLRPCRLVGAGAKVGLFCRADAGVGEWWL